MRSLSSKHLSRPAATSRLRAGIIGLLLATCAALAAPTVGAEPIQSSQARPLFATVQITEVDAHAAVTAVHDVDGVMASRKFVDPPERDTTSVHAWAG